MGADDPTDEINARREVEEELGIPMGSEEALQLHEGKELSEKDKLKTRPLMFVDTVRYESDEHNFFANVYLMEHDGCDLKL